MLFAMTRSGVKVDEGLLTEENKSLEADIRQFAARAAQILKPGTQPIVAEALVAQSDWILLPLGRVARLLGTNSPYKFWLPDDGGAVEVGLLTIGAKSENAPLAKQLINEFISTDHALEVHRRLGPEWFTPHSIASHPLRPYSARKHYEDFRSISFRFRI